MTSYRREAFCGLYYSKGPISLYSGQNKTLVIDFLLLRKPTVEGNPSFWRAFLIKNLLYLSFFTFELFKSLRSVQQQRSGPGGSSCPLAQAAAAHGSGRSPRRLALAACARADWRPAAGQLFVISLWDKGAACDCPSYEDTIFRLMAGKRGLGLRRCPPCTLISTAVPARGPEQILTIHSLTHPQAHFYLCGESLR